MGIAAQVRSGALTARQAVERALQAIEDRDGPLQAFQEVRAFASLREADQVDARTDLGTLALAGVPIAIKDNVSVAGEPKREGSLGSDPAPQTEDHPVVRRLRDAGAVVVGLTRVPELCIYGTTDSEFGVTANPWDRSRTPGGSSGGAAAAVAAGMVPVAHGNDGLGSIRIPAACCGLVGIKPGLGLVPSRLSGSSWFDMAENGALATTVTDAALVLSTMAERPALADVHTPRGLRIALSTKAPTPATPVDRHWEAAARETGTLLRGAGHTVSQADPPYSQQMAASNLVRWVAGTELNARELADRSKLSRRHPPARRAGQGGAADAAAARDRPHQVAACGGAVLRRLRRAADADLGAAAPGSRRLGRAGLAAQRLGERALRPVRRTVEPGWLAGHGGTGRARSGRPATVRAAGSTPGQRIAAARARRDARATAAMAADRAGGPILTGAGFGRRPTVWS